jgi:hypothetical protein
MCRRRIETYYYFGFTYFLRLQGRSVSQTRKKWHQKLGSYRCFILLYIYIFVVSLMGGLQWPHPLTHRVHNSSTNWLHNYCRHNCGYLLPSLNYRQPFRRIVEISRYYPCRDINMPLYTVTTQPANVLWTGICHRVHNALRARVQ